MWYIHRGKLSVWCWTWNSSGRSSESLSVVVWHHQLRVQWQLKHPARATIINQSLGTFYPSGTPQGGHMQFWSLHLKKKVVRSQRVQKNRIKKAERCSSCCMRRDFWKVWGLQARKGQGGWKRQRLGKLWKHWLRWMQGSCWTNMQDQQLHYSVFW